MLKIFMVTFSLMWFSCAQKAVNPWSTATTQVLFPDGVYKQDINVEYKEAGEVKQTEFKAVLKKTPDEINMYNYIGFGIPLYKVKDNLKGSIEFVANDPRVEKNRELFLRIYPIIKQVLMLRRDDPKLKEPKMTFIVPPDGYPIDVIILEWLSNGDPAKFVFENKNHFKFEVTTRQYNTL